jgi:hypothetical protein
MLAIIMLQPRVVGVGGLDAAGRARASRQGIRQFVVVGTGGADLLGFAAAKPNSQRRLAGVHGVLELVLHPASYQWRFVSEDGPVLDRGGPIPCH